MGSIADYVLDVDLGRNGETFKAAPGAGAYIVPGLDPPSILAGAECDFRHEGTGGVTTHCRGIIPFAVNCRQGTTCIDLTDPQIIPGGIADFIPSVGGRWIA